MGDPNGQTADATISPLLTFTHPTNDVLRELNPLCLAHTSMKERHVALPVALLKHWPMAILIKLGLQNAPGYVETELACADVALLYQVAKRHFIGQIVRRPIAAIHGSDDKSLTFRKLLIAHRSVEGNLKKNLHQSLALFPASVMTVEHWVHANPRHVGMSAAL